MKYSSMNVSKLQKILRDKDETGIMLVLRNHIVPSLQRKSHDLRDLMMKELNGFEFKEVYGYLAHLERQYRGQILLQLMDTGKKLRNVNGNASPFVNPTVDEVQKLISLVPYHRDEEMRVLDLLSFHLLTEEDLEHRSLPKEVESYIRHQENDVVRNAVTQRIVKRMLEHKEDPFTIEQVISLCKQLDHASWLSFLQAYYFRYELMNYGEYKRLMTCLEDEEKRHLDHDTVAIIGNRMAKVAVEKGFVTATSEYLPKVYWDVSDDQAREHAHQAEAGFIKIFLEYAKNNTDPEEDFMSHFKKARNTRSTPWYRNTLVIEVLREVKFSVNHMRRIRKEFADEGHLITHVEIQILCFIGLLGEKERLFTSEQYLLDMVEDFKKLNLAYMALMTTIKDGKILDTSVHVVDEEKATDPTAKLTILFESAEEELINVFKQKLRRQKFASADRYLFLSRCLSTPRHRITFLLWVLEMTKTALTSEVEKVRVLAYPFIRAYIMEVEAFVNDPLIDDHKMKDAELEYLRLKIQAMGLSPTIFATHINNLHLVDSPLDEASFTATTSVKVSSKKKE